MYIVRINIADHCMLAKVECTVLPGPRKKNWKAQISEEPEVFAEEMCWTFPDPSRSFQILPGKWTSLRAFLYRQQSSIGSGGWAKYGKAKLKDAIAKASWKWVLEFTARKQLLHSQTVFRTCFFSIGQYRPVTGFWNLLMWDSFTQFRQIIMCSQRPRTK